MAITGLDKHRIGWVGAGRMGFSMASRLLKAGCDLAVYNRTRAKAEPLTELGATVVDCPADLADRDIVFTMVAGPEDFLNVVSGENGILSRDGTVPRILIDCTSVSEEASAAVRLAVAADFSHSAGTVVLEAAARWRRELCRKRGSCRST